MEKRYITLSEEERVKLSSAYRRGTKTHFRNRCRAILLSDKNYDIDALSDIFGVQRQSIYRWFNSYEKNGLLGLENQGKRGRKPILEINNKKTVSTVKKIIEQDAQNSNKVLAQLEKELGVKLSKRTLNRFLKRLVTDGNDIVKV